jgi:uncharacterized protein (DUF58 family)
MLDIWDLFLLRILLLYPAGCSLGLLLMLAYTLFVFFSAWFIGFHLGILGELHFVHRARTRMDGRKSGETPSNKTYFL